MLSPRTDEKLREGLRILAQDQKQGKAPPEGEVTRADIARRAGISEGTISNIEHMFKARLAAAILKDPASPKLLRNVARQFLSEV